MESLDRSSGSDLPDEREMRPALAGHESRSALSPAGPLRREVTRAAEVGHGRTVSRSPCHQRRVGIEGDASGSRVAVRCPYCSQLWEVRFAPTGTEPMFALWVA